MKNGRTHPAYKAEQAGDLEKGVVLPSDDSTTSLGAAPARSADLAMLPENGHFRHGLLGTKISLDQSRNRITKSF